MTRRQRTDFLWILLIMALCCVATCALTPAPPPPVTEVDASLWFRKDSQPHLAEYVDPTIPPVLGPRVLGRKPRQQAYPYQPHFTGSRVERPKGAVPYTGVIGPRTYPHHRKQPAP